MGKYKRRALLSAVAVLCLLAGFVVPALISADNAKISASSTMGPDLIVQEITWLPENPLMGNAVIFTVTIKNQGDSQAGYSHVAFFINDTYQTSKSIKLLDPGATATSTFTWRAEADSHSIKAIADVINHVTESNEANNEKTYAISILAPDLIVESITWSPENPSIGDKVTFSVTVKNRGNYRAGGSNVDFYIDGYSRGYRFVMSTEPGATVNQTFIWTALPGSHSVSAFADILRQAKESDETNNEKTVTYATAAPDLIIDSITWSPKNPSENTMITLKVTIKNQGSGKAEYSLVDYYVDGIYRDSAHIGQLDIGAKTTTTIDWITRAKPHTFEAIADAGNRVIESDETNNTKSIDMPTPSPDLVIQDITWSPSSPLILHRMTFTVTFKNQGKSTSGICYLYLYIDNAYKYTHFLTPIAPGATETRTTSWTAKKASHEIRAVIDEENYINESNEDNNTKSKKVSCSHPSPSSDLIIEDITWSPEYPSTGDVVTFTITIKNLSKSQASSFHLAFYSEDSLLATAYANQIQPDTTSTSTFTWEAQPGLHAIKTVVDIYDSIYETNESNNEKTVVLSTTAPDLVIQDVDWSLAHPSPGDEATLIITIKNQGDELACDSYVGYYIGDDYRGNHYVEEIDAGATATKTFTWTAQTEPQVINIVADIDNSISESNEDNNEYTFILPVPDLVIDEITWSPVSPTENTSVTFTVTIRNQGGAQSDSFPVSCYVDNVLLTSVDIGQIQSGIQATSTFTWEAQAGSHTIKTVADEYNDIVESDESNNEKTAVISIPIPPAPPPAPEPAAEIPVTTTTDLEQSETQVNPEDEIKAAIIQEMVSDIAEEPPSAPSSQWEGFMLSWWFVAALVAAGSTAILILLRFRRRPHPVEDISSSLQESDV